MSAFLHVDASDDEQFAQWFGVLHRAEVLREGTAEGGWQPQEWRARGLHENGPVRYHLSALVHEGVFVAVASLQENRDDNLGVMRMDLFVDPARRREGHGSTLLAYVERFARERHQHTLIAWVQEGAAEIAQAPNRTFAPRHGFVVGDEMVRREIAWPVGDERRRAWRDEIASFHDDYAVVTWRSQVPDEFAPSYAELAGRMIVEAPYANLDFEQEQWDVERLRGHELEISTMGRELFIAAAIDTRDNRVAGYSELTLSRIDTHTAYQWDTLVARAHRGHGLGRRMKVANLLAFHEAGTATARVSTNNSLINEHMIAVNEWLGATVAGAMVLWKKELTPAPVAR